MDLIRPRLTDHYGIHKSQADLDFAIQFFDEDISECSEVGLGVSKTLSVISTIKENDNVTISIKDNAGGIAEDILPRIFEPYFTTKHKSQGTGLGLHMTYNLIVEGMNGTIEANNSTFEYENISYTGAEIKITLPLN